MTTTHPPATSPPSSARRGLSITGPGFLVGRTTARLRRDVFGPLEDMPRGALASELRVSTSTLRSYVTGTTVPEGGMRGGGPLDRLAGLLGVQTVELMEFRPLAQDERPRHATYSPCPPWCTSHELLVMHAGGLRGEVDVLRNEHVGRTTSGPFTATLTQLGYVDWPNTFLDIDGPDGCQSWRIWPTADGLRWLSGQVGHLAGLFQEIAGLPGLD